MIGKHAAFLAATVCVPTLIHPAEAKITKFDPSGSTETTPFAINVSGVIVGDYLDGKNKGHPFLRNADGSFTIWSIKGAKFGSYAVAINKQGVVTGGYGDRFDRRRGYLRAPDGTITKFDPSSSYWTSPNSINDKGQITGCYNENVGDSGCQHGFVRGVDGSFATFDVPGAAYTDAICINNPGVIAGYYNDTGNVLHGFVRTPDGTITAFDPSGSIETAVEAINNLGVVVGFYQTNYNPPTYFGFIRAADGTITSINVAGKNQTIIFGVNSDDTITGYYFDDLYHGFVQTVEGKITTFDPKNAISTNPEAINKSVSLRQRPSCTESREVTA